MTRHSTDATSERLHRPPFSSFPVLLLFVSLLLVFSCNRPDRSDRPQKEIYPARLHSDAGDTLGADIRYARGFRLNPRDGYELLEILQPYQDRTDTLRYALVPRGDPDAASEAPGEYRKIEVPVRSMIVTSTTHIGLTDMLGANDVIKGVTQADYVYNREIRDGLEQGRIIPFGSGEFNLEQALALGPDLIMVSGGPASRLKNPGVLRDAGINILVNSEWLENTPLGKAEWVKVMGALLGRKPLAAREFGKVERKYLDLKEKVDHVKTKPLVINNMPYKGAWFVSGGESYTAQYLQDAGADYAWFDRSTAGGLRLGFEAVYEVGLRADVWINPGSARTKQDILASDSRFRNFKSFRNGNIYNNNRRMSASGGNDFWESGVVHPERVLADLIHIFHPSVLPDHRLYYYRNLE